MPRTVLAGLAGGLALLAAAPTYAQSGGASAPTSSGPTPSTSAPASSRSATTPGLGTLRVGRSGTTGRTVAATAAVSPGLAGRTLHLQRRAGGRWRLAARASVSADGDVRFGWRTRAARRHSLRLVRPGSAAARPRATGTPAVAITVFDRVTATWYGPGFYGRRTACGQTMSTTLVGVAHRTLPCGTRVEVARAGRRITVPVVDRGPYANHATIDLTAAAADRLGQRATLRVGLATRPDLPRSGR